MANDDLKDSERTWPEGATPSIQFTLLDSAGTPIPLANVLTFTISQWIGQPGKPGRTINSRSSQNAKNANGITVDSTDGGVTWVLTTADTAMQSKDLSVTEERHYFRFDLAYTSSAGTITHSGPGSRGEEFYVICRKTPQQ